MAKSLSIVTIIVQQPSTLTYSVDHTVLVEGKGSTTIPLVGL